MTDVDLLVPFFVTTFIGYMFGAIPTGYLAGRAWGVDVRKYGSGRTGGTNVLRTVGAGAFLLTVLGDLIKGLAAVLLVRWLFHLPLLDVVAALFAVVGHSKSFLIGFRGGAGSMTGIGALLALNPFIVILMLPVPIVTLLLTRYASLASILGAISTPLIIASLVVWARLPVEYLILGLIGAAYVVYNHRPNIARLRAGTERRIGEKIAIDRG